MSFIADRVVMDGLTFDDVLLIPAYSEVLPRNVDLTTKFSRNITLNIPDGVGRYGYGYRGQVGYRYRP